MTQTKRKYAGSDVDMVLAISTITDAAITHKTLLQSKRSTWADPFFDTLKADIDLIIRDHLGVDSAKDLRLATQAVEGMHYTALGLLAELKVQISEDLKKDKIRRDEVLKELGLATYLKDAQKGDHQAMINLLYQFTTNMTAPLQAEIIALGTAPATIAGINSFAQALKDKNISQQSSKLSRKETTEDTVKAFNDIYDRVMSVSKIAAKFYRDEEAKAAQFSYARVKAALSSARINAADKPIGQ